MNLFEKLTFGDKRVLKLLNQAKDDENEIKKIYCNLLEELNSSEYWSNSENTAPKVKWSDGINIKSIQKDIFSNSGLYLWGADNIPRYIGMTKQNFGERFKRYIGNDNSQCKLAEKYEKELKANGINGFPNEVRKWYKRGFRNSTVRLEGAVDFAKHGINNIWFALFPADDVNAIRLLEKRLIKIAYAWNLEKGFEPLLNKQHIK
jgi:hypothetical protein